MTNIIEKCKPIMETFGSFFNNNPFISDWIITISHLLFVLLALYIVGRPIFSLLSAKNPSEIWAYLVLPGGITKPLRHWENLLGRSNKADVSIDVLSVSRSHGTLVRNSNDDWFYNDLNSKGGSKINGVPVRGTARVRMGDCISLGGADCYLSPTSLEEQKEILIRRKHISTTFSPWSSLIALSIFQFLTMINFIASRGSSLPFIVLISFIMLTITMWMYCIILSGLGRKAFEMEIIAFFLSTLGLSVTATSAPDATFKQVIAIILGVLLFFILCWYLRKLERALAIRRILVIGSVILLALNLVIGTYKLGATNWISIGSMSIQPSELVKISFIFVGAATLDELFQKVNLGLFLGFSAICLGSLAIMGDFGTASIFFVTFLVISFMRSGDYSKLFLIIGGAAMGGLMVLRFKPYIMNRFNTWLHAWQYADAGGYQQTRTMTASASGGLLGIGPGEGFLHNLKAADTDLVFGILSEEWGLIIALLAVISIVTLGVFAIKSIRAGRSSYYTIAACAATTLFIFQIILNMFGSLDLLPLTGVTFPFVSNGGTSVLVSWGLLSFLKAADTRQGASLAVSSQKLKGGNKE